MKLCLLLLFICLICKSSENNSSPVLVSVIIPVSRHRFHVLTDAVYSVLAQRPSTLVPFRLQLLIVLNGCPQDTVLDLPDNPVIEIIRHEGALHVGAARNLGLQRASGDFLAFLDSDDIWLAGKLASQLEAMRSPTLPQALSSTHGGKKEILASCSEALSNTRPRLKRRRGDGQLLFRPWPRESNDAAVWPSLVAGLIPTNSAYYWRSYRHLLARFGFAWPSWFDRSILERSNPIITSSVLLHRQALHDAGANGLFDSSLELGAEDIDLWLRIVKAGHSFLFIHQPLLIYDETHGSEDEAPPIHLWETALDPEAAETSWYQDEDFLGVYSNGNAWQRVTSDLTI